MIRKLSLTRLANYGDLVDTPVPRLGVVQVAPTSQ